MNSTTTNDFKNCQVFTPSNIVTEMLDFSGYIDNLENINVLENSVGDGQFITEVALRLIKYLQKENYSSDMIKNKLENNLTAYEIDPYHANKCRANLDNIAATFHLENVNWNIKNIDYLKDKSTNEYDLIIGNPPYIQYRNLSIENRLYIKTEFESCKKGKPDYYYAFLEKSVKELSNRGKLVYLIPTNVFKNKFGYNIRKILLKHITDVIDYNHMKLFDYDNRNTVSTIIQYDKSNSSKEFNYINKETGNRIVINKEQLTDKWNFSNEVVEKREYLFSDYFEVRYTIATLLNSAFVLDENEMNRNHLEIYLGDLIKPAASPRGMSMNKTEYIIFPYRYINNELVKVNNLSQENRLYKYLGKFRGDLKKRDSDSNIKWYQYGRTQGLLHLNQRKILISTVITNQAKSYLLDIDVIPYSGIVITTNEENRLFDLEDATQILESQDFMDYVKVVGLKSSDRSYRITASDIKNYRFSGGNLWRN